jgi:enamine deaminase RidA (YjgF/YER057c/UK114 family)
MTRTNLPGPAHRSRPHRRRNLSLIRKCSQDHVGYSVVDLGGVSRILAAAVPRTGGGTTAEQADDALQTIAAVMHDEGTRGAIVEQAVFYRDPADHDLCRSVIRNFYGDEMPATTFINQPPLCNRKIAVEALGVGRAGEPVSIHRFGEKCVVTQHAGINWYHCGPITPQPSAVSIYDRSRTVFERLSAMLASKGARFENVIRTWLYLGDIVGEEDGKQRYKELNRARTDFFADKRFAKQWVSPHFTGTVYPAGTGIGANNGDLTASCIAIDGAPDAFTLTPLENPLQTSAFDYSEQYSPQSPKFARAMVLSTGPWATIFVSGTASITNAETVWPGDVVKQTEQTLDNIAALISEANLARHGLTAFAPTLEDLACVRVYIKHAADCAAVKKACAERLGEVPIIYAQADVCRDDLLVEIEGTAFVRRYE